MRFAASFALMILLGLATIPAAAKKTKTRKTSSSAPGLAQLQKMTARFAPTPLRVDTSKLSSADRQALVKLIEAGRIMNHVFLVQYWSGNPALYSRLQKDTTPLGKARLRYFWINKSPWSALDDFKAFLPGVPAGEAQGSKFLSRGHDPGGIREPGLRPCPRRNRSRPRDFSPLSAARPDAGSKTLVAVPYSEAYKDDLTRAASLLKEAANLTDNDSLKNFLNLRADAFLSNDYYASDLAWMDLDSPIDITIGPYETYDDQIFGYKAAFETFLNLRDDEESAKFSALSAHLQEIEDNLPIDPQYRNPKLGAAAPIRVVDEICVPGTPTTEWPPPPTICRTTSGW